MSVSVCAKGGLRPAFFCLRGTFPRRISPHRPISSAPYACATRLASCYALYYSELKRLDIFLRGGNMKRILLFSLLMSTFLLANGCTNGSYHDYDSRHRPPPPGHRPPPDYRPEHRPDNKPALRPDDRPAHRPENKPQLRPEHKPGPPPTSHPDSRPNRPVHRP